MKKPVRIEYCSSDGRSFIYDADNRFLCEAASTREAEELFHAINAMQPEGGWIAWTDRKPAHGQKVLAWDAAGPWTCIFEYMGGRRWGVELTHWQPLPEEPLPQKD